MEEQKQKPKDAPQAAPAVQETAADLAKKSKGKKKSWKSVTFARVYITCSFNNTIVTFTDDKGDTIAWASAGSSGFKGTKKGTPFAAQITANKVAHRASELGVKQVTIFVSGPGPGRETAIRAIGGAGLSVMSIKDITPLPHNGCRPPAVRGASANIGGP